ncbi:tripartite tricarboxylate transporter substrate binding protein [Rubrobacter taiwanensis]|uniref:Tripartite tricarboxylate transporter substrate binding protein n=2 Tax=Rubrobacter taiwanensis TaxID=185139 RepID=A0A4R1BI84_9ACTN|nr:tripartite tricarboxylate transporter substrate binding protein [Rubrobacter taiwanensis]
MGCAAQEGGDSYPNRSISYVIPFDPGGESDITARIQQGPLEEALGVSVVVSHQPGGGGALGWSELTRTEPDGYTIMGHNLPHIILQPMVRDDAGYETDQINQVYIFQSTPNALVVPEDSPYQSLEDLIRAAEENPGSITLGGSGEYTANHIGTLLLNELAGVEFTYVPFTGTGSAVPALLGGQVDGLMTYTTAALDMEEQGVRVLAVAAEERVSQLPDAPTFQEEGYDLVEGAFRGVAVPPETPEEIIQTLAEAFREVNNDPQVIEQMEELGFTLENLGPEEARELTQERREVYERLLEDLEELETG